MYAHGSCARTSVGRDGIQQDGRGRALQDDGKERGSPASPTCAPSRDQEDQEDRDQDQKSVFQAPGRLSLLRSARGAVGPRVLAPHAARKTSEADGPTARAGGLPASEPPHRVIAASSSHLLPCPCGQSKHVGPMCPHGPFPPAPSHSIQHRRWGSVCWQAASLNSRPRTSSILLYSTNTISHVPTCPSPAAARPTAAAWPWPCAHVPTCPSYTIKVQIETTTQLQHQPVCPSGRGRASL